MTTWTGWTDKHKDKILLINFVARNGRGNTKFLFLTSIKQNLASDVAEVHKLGCQLVNLSLAILFERQVFSMLLQIFQQ